MASATRASTKLQSDELKDAYRVWLKDLYDDKPDKLLRKLGNKKKKSGGARRARRAQRLQHAQQHTAASALKDVALKKAERATLPALSSQRYLPVDKQALHDSQSRRHQALVDEANYSSFQYAHHPSWRPGLAFYQQLVRYVLVQKASSSTNSSDEVVSAELAGFPMQVAPILLRVPVRRNRLGVALLFCQEQNQNPEQQGLEVVEETAAFVLHCRLYSRVSDWREHRDTLLDIVSNSSAEVCAVTKCAEDFESRSNEIKCLRSRQEVGQAMDELWVKYSDTDDARPNVDTDLFAIQKYIPFKGASSSAFAANSTPPVERKAWIARCASRKRDKNSSTVWIITGGDSTDCSSAITNSGSTNCQLVKCNIDQAWPEPRLLASMCAISLEKAVRLRFNELVLDLLQDTTGTWCLLQVKAFTLASIRPASATLLPSKATPRGLSRTLSAPTQFGAGMVPTPHWRKWRCAGRYCTKNRGKDLSELVNQLDDEDIDDDKEPSGYLTKKVLRSCEFYDDFVRQQDMSLAGGFTEFHSALSFHLQHRLPKRDRTQLYESQPLCSACIRRYHTLRQQWIETVEAPKATPTPVRQLRKPALPKASSHEHTDQILLHPRKLPSLNRDFGKSSVSSLTTSTSRYQASTLDAQEKSSHAEDHESITKTPSYVNEIAEMEEMLAEHAPPSLLTKTKGEVQSPERYQTATVSSFGSKRDEIFPNWNGVNRIEAMWQNLTLKPLERQLNDPSLEQNGTTNQGYNSISLQLELARVAERGDSNDESRQQSPLEPQVDRPSPVVKAHVKSVDLLHTVHVEYCRRVFEDEIYREGLVNDAISALRSGNSNVCFVVAARSGKKGLTGGDEVELAEMALRSLYIDVKQAVAASSEEFVFGLSLASWPMRPTLRREDSGSIMVKLGPA